MLNGTQALLTNAAVMKAAQTLGIIVLVLFLRLLVLRAVERKVAHPDTRLLWRQVTNYVTLTIFVLVVGQLWLQGFGAALTVLSLVAAALTIVHKELIISLAAWPVITWRRLFGVGDRIQMGAHAGEVVDLGILYFTVTETGGAPGEEAHTGRVVKIPNSLIFTMPVVNYSRTLSIVWHQVKVKITKSSSVEAAKAICLEAAKAVGYALNEEEARQLIGTNEEHVYQESSPNVVALIRDEKVVIVVRYLSPFQELLTREGRFWDLVLTRVHEADQVELSLL